MVSNANFKVKLVVIIKKIDYVREVMPVFFNTYCPIFFQSKLLGSHMVI